MSTHIVRATVAPAFSLQLVQPPADAKTIGPLRFRVTDSAGAAVTDYDVVHERKLHLLTVRDGGLAPKDREPRFTDFQHVHPSYVGDGVWELNDFRVPRAGGLRLFTDFATKGQAGAAQLALPVGGPQQGAAVDKSGGYSAKLVSATAMGQAVHAVVQLNNSDGSPVVDVRPWLGASAHWALFDASSGAERVAQAHAHPMGQAKDGKVEFHVIADTGGRASWQGWLQFQPGGQDLVAVPLALAAQPPGPGHGGGGHGPGHDGHQ